MLEAPNPSMLICLRQRPRRLFGVSSTHWLATPLLLVATLALPGCFGRAELVRAAEAEVRADAGQRPEAAGNSTDADRLTYSEARGGRPLWRNDLPTFTWAHDGQHITSSESTRWIDPRSGEEVEAKSSPSTSERPRPSRNQVRAALSAMYPSDRDQARRWLRSFDRNGGVGVVRAKNRLHLYRNEELKKIGSGGETGARLSPDGKWVAYVRNHNVHALPTTGGDEVAVTTAGHRRLLHGRLDWVYQEEIYGRGTWNAMWWSPASTGLAFLRLDEEGVPTFPIVDHRAFGVEAENMFYPKAGDTNPKVSLGVWSPGGDVIWCDLGNYNDEILIVSVAWNPEGDRVVFQIQDREQNWLDLNYADPKTGNVTRILRETTGSWVNVLEDPRWLDDGTFLWLSERSGYKHVYHYRADGELIRPVTSGDWAVRRLLRVDDETTAESAAVDGSGGRLWFTANRESAVGNHAYRVDLDGSDLVHLTPGRGTHSIEVNESGTMVLDRFSSLATPPRARVLDINGTVLRELGTASSETTRPAAKTVLHQVAARDGFPLDVTVTLPVDFSEDRKYAVWLPTYSGPDAPSIRDRWRPSMWTQFLTEQGIVVLQVNNRSSSGKGHAVISACHRQLGVSELRDIEDAVRWISKNAWVDRSRIGITGGSYGGFMAAYALTHSDLFALGVAWAGVYDWRCYDTIYTERYMDTPQNNASGYAKTSVVGAAARLQGHLVIGHGSMDDNVHMQNAMQLAEALQKAGKNFDLMIYPGARHGIRNRSQRAHWNKLKWDAIREHLVAPRDSQRVAL